MLHQFDLKIFLETTSKARNETHFWYARYVEALIKRQPHICIKLQEKAMTIIIIYEGGVQSGLAQ